MRSATSDDRQSYTIPRRPWSRWWRRGWVGILLLVLLVVGLHAGWGAHANSKLRAELDAYRRAGEPVLPADFAATAVPDDQNAAVPLREAAAAIDKSTAAWKRYDDLQNSAGYVRVPMTGEEFETYAGVVAEGAAVFAAVRRAAGRPQVEWGVSPDPTKGPVALSMDLSHLTRQREVANLLAAAALHAHESGDDAEALRFVADIMVISRAVDAHPSLVSHLTSTGIYALACDVLSQVTPELRATNAGGGGPAVAPPPRVGGSPPIPRPAARGQVAAMIGDLLNEAPLVPARQRMLLGERMALVDAALAVADGRIGLKDFDSNSAGNPKRVSAAVTGYALRPLALNDARLMARYVSDVRAALAAPDYPTFLGRPGSSTPMEFKVRNVRHPVAAMLVPNLDRAVMHDYMILANRRMTAVALACRLYALDHDGQLPPALAGLVPKYLPAVPTDPLTTGRPLGYLPDADHPIVYNVGENLKDDGGYEPAATTPRRDWVRLADDVRHLRHQPRPAAEKPAGDIDPVLPHGPYPDDLGLPGLVPDESATPEPPPPGSGPAESAPPASGPSESYRPVSAPASPRGG